jgi:hypothetical protein
MHGMRSPQGTIVGKGGRRGWLTPAGAVLGVNSMVTGNVAGKATQAYLGSTKD